MRRGGKEMQRRKKYTLLFFRRVDKAKKQMQEPILGLVMLKIDQEMCVF